jgi:predicted DNA-binding transcriptional regulator AlpA
MRVRSIRNMTESDVNTATPSNATAGTSSAPKTALTETEAAHYIGMSPAWLKKSRTNRFRNVIDAPPFVRAGAKRVVYRIEDLDAWQERHLERVGPGENGMVGRVAGDLGEGTMAQDSAPSRDRL